MNYRVVERQAFSVIGKSAHSSAEKDIWGRCKRDGTIEKLLEIGVNKDTLGLCFGYDADGNNTYMVGIESALNQVDGMETYTLPKSSWLIFEAAGSISAKTLGATWRRIYGEFLPQSTYRQQAKLPTIEVYRQWDVEKDFCNCEIWIPLE
jgi:AraC family transcriptional regulator